MLNMLPLVTLGGAVLFLIFGMVYAHEGYYWEEGLEPSLGDLVSSAADTASKKLLTPGGE